MSYEKQNPASRRALSKVVQLNNFGVQCFEAKDYLGAINRFREALEWISSPVFHSETVNVDEQHICSSQSACSCTINPCAPILKAKVPSDDTCTDVQSFLCFTQAMEIVDSPTAYSTNPMANEVLMSAMMIWNMAVVYHCTSRGNDSRLSRAYSLYLKSWNLVEYIVDHGSNGNPMMDFFTQALLNNLGCCCQELGLYSNAQMWSDHLISYAQSMGFYLVDDSSDVSMRLQEQTNHFVLNAIMRLQCRPSFLASAA